MDFGLDKKISDSIVASLFSLIVVAMEREVTAWLREP
jgi:hypothetical protein